MSRDHYRVNKHNTSRIKHESVLDRLKKPKISKLSLKEKKDLQENYVDFKPIEQDLVTATIATLSPTKNESEQLIVIKEHADGNWEYVHIDSDGAMTEVSTREEVYTNAPVNSLHDIHTHPSWSIHSAADLLIMLKYPSVKTLHLVTPKGIVYTATRDRSHQGDHSNIKEKDLQQEINLEIENSRTKVTSMLQLGLELPPGSSNDKEMAAQIIAMRSIGKKYGFTYTASLQDKKLYDRDLKPINTKETEL